MRRESHSSNSLVRFEKLTTSERSRGGATTSEPLDFATGNVFVQKSSASRPSCVTMGSAASRSHQGAIMPPA